jgi:hypothetical protein
MSYLSKLEEEYSQQTQKEGVAAQPTESAEPPKPEGYLAKLESEYKSAPTEKPKSYLEGLDQKYDVNPDSLRGRKERGEPLSEDQERVIFDADRARSAGEQAAATGKGVFTSLSELVPQAFEGTKKIIGASKDLTKQIGLKYLDVNPIVPEIAVDYIAGNTAEDRQTNLEKAAKKEQEVVRSAASGAVQAGEEVINEAARGAFFGTPLTDLIQEYPAGKLAFEAMKAGGPVAFATEALGQKIFGAPLVDVQPITKDESFQRSRNRESMRQQEQQEYKDLPERTTAALVKLAESSAGSALGKSLGVPSNEQFQKDLVQELKDRAIVPDKDIAMIGNMLSPLDPTFVLAGPLARASSKAFDLASGAGLRALTKPTIAGMNPLEATGRVIRFGGEGTQKAARKFSDFLTGSEDSFIGKLADPIVAVTRRPGMIVEGAGRALRDIGRQIDDVGVRSRTGIIERAGQDARSGDFMRTVFGPGTEKAQAKALKAAEKVAGEGGEASLPASAFVSKRQKAARTADWVFRQAEAIARYGTSGAAIGTALGLPDIENAEQLGQMATTGAMVGAIGGMRLGEKGAKLIDPRVSLKGKIDAILADDPVSRRADEDADIERFRNTAAPDIISKADEFGNINSVLQSFDGHLQNLAIQRDQAIARGEADVAAGMELEIKKTAASKDAVAKMTPDAMKEYQRRVDLTLADSLDLAKTTGEAVGLNNVEIKLLSPVEMLGHLRDKWGSTLTNAEYVLQSLAGNNDLSDADQQKLNQATETVNQFNAMYQTAMAQRGYAMSENTYSDSPMHLRPANLKTPSVVVNSELVKSQLGNNLYATLNHELLAHALRNFKEVKAMMGPLEEYLFGKKVQNADGSITEISKGIYDDAAIDRMGDYYAELLGGDKWKAGFSTEQQYRSYIKEEILAEAAGLSSNTANLRADLDSPGQAFVDWAATSNKNTFIGKIRDALGLKGVLLDDAGRISDILGETISPEVLALTRQYQRQLRDYNGSLSQVTSATGPEVTISAVELLSSKILQNKYRGLDIWQKEQVLTIKDDEGNVVNEIVVPQSASLNALVGQYRLEDGMLVDENGNKMQIAPEIAAANLPNNTNISVDQRIARNPDGSPKILSNREIQARARKRGEVLKNAIEGAMEDGSTNRVRPVGENEYAGILSPTQLQAILALPNDIVAPELKRKIAAFNETALRKDGTRMIVEYQAAMKGGKYKALAPKIRDVVPFGFRITKDGNFLATTISVSRIFDKINDWAKPNRNRLNLWNGDTNALWEDILHVLTNHQKGERGEVGLDVDPDMAMLKKDRINDIFNLFDKATESKNPDRSVSKTRKGQDSIDRVIMGMRMDRVNDFQISNAQKIPVDYGKIKENYMPNVPVDVVQNNVAEEGRLGYKESPTIKYREPKYETTNPPRLGYIDPRTTEEGQRVLREDPTLARAFAALEGASEAGGDQRPTSGSSVIPAETEALREFAKNSGTMESPEVVQKFTDDWNAENRTAGTEHQVLLGNGDRVEKRFTATYNDTWKNYLNRILLHNILFRDSAIRLEGFQEVPEITQDRNGQEWSPGFYAKISQPYARGKHVDLIKDLKPYMESLGFVSNGPMNYYHPEYGVHVSDMHPGNAYVETDAQGNKHVNVFDPNLHLTGEKEGDAKERARVEAKLATQRPVEEVGFSWPQEVDAAIGRMKSVVENPQNMPTEVKPEAPLPVNLYEAGTSLESFGVNSLKEIAEHYGFPVPDKAKRGEIIDLVENRSSEVQFKPATIRREVGKNEDFLGMSDEKDAQEALDVSKRPKFGLARDLEQGYPVALRIDIPAFNRTGNYVVTVHEKGTPSKVGEVIGYDNVARVDNPTFMSNETGAEKISKGESKKFPIATVAGEFNPSREIPADINDWTPVGFDPKEHSYFYDKATDELVLGGDEAVSVGNTVFVKNPVYGDKGMARFMPAAKGDSPQSSLSKDERDAAVKFLERGTLSMAEVHDSLAKLANGDVQSITEKLSTGRLFELAHKATGTPILNRVDALSAVRRNINSRKDALTQSSMASPMADDIVRTPVNRQAAQGLAFKPSERYTTVEVAPDPEDKKAVEAWNSFNEASKKIVTEKVANDMLPKIASDMGLPEPIITHIIGGFLKETNPSVLVEFPSDIPYEKQMEFAKVAGHLLKQQAVITFDEANKTDDQAFFVGLTPSRELSYEETSELYKKINDQMEEAAGFTGKTDQLVFGNFSEMSNEDFYTKLKSVVDEVGTGVDYGINTVQHEFRSNYIETGSPDTLNETQYGKGNTQEGGTGGDSIRGAQGRFDALQTATNEAVRGAIESERASAAGETTGVTATPQASVMPQSALNVLHADSADLPKPEKKITNARVAVNIADIAEKYWGGKITSETITPEQEQQLIDNGAEEAIAALTASGRNAGNWYFTAIKAAIAVVGVIHKQLSSLVEANKIPYFAKESNPVEAAQFILRLPLAITSQNMTVPLNARFSEEQYNHYVKNGEFDPSKQYGEKAKSISGNLKLANTMIKNHGGILQLQEFVKQEFTVRDLEKVASKIAGQKVTISGRKDDIVNGAAIFGPKIGQGFLQNLMGKFDPVTIDLWMRRTWGRWTGDVVGDGVTGTRLARLIDESRNSGRKLPPSLKNLRTVDRSLDVKKSGEPTKPVRTISENVEERLENDPQFRKDVETLAKEWNREFQKYYDFMGAPISPATAQGIRDLIANQAPEADITKAYNKLIRSQSKIREDLDEAYKQLSPAQKRTAEGKNIPKDTWIAEQHAKNGRTEVLTNPEKNKLKPQWANAAKSIVAELNPIDIPTDQDRVVITRIVNGIRKKLEDKGYTVTNADIQAILWYPEKDLWAKLRGEEESNLNTSYDDEFIKIAEQRGLGAEAKAIAKPIRGY